MSEDMNLAIIRIEFDDNKPDQAIIIAAINLAKQFNCRVRFDWDVFVVTISPDDILSDKLDEFEWHRNHRTFPPRQDEGFNWSKKFEEDLCS